MNLYNDINESIDNYEQDSLNYSGFPYPHSYNFIYENQIPNFMENENNFSLNISKEIIISLSSDKKKIEDSENFQIEGKSTNSKTIMNNYKSFKDIKTILGGKCSIIDDTEDKILFEIESNIKHKKKIIEKPSMKNLK